MDFAQFKSGYRMCGHPPSAPKRIASRVPWPPVPVHARIRRSSIRCRIGTTSEAWRHLDSSGGKEYVGKPRPVVIVQNDRFDATNSITICAFTTDSREAPLFRLLVLPNERNGLRAACRLMVDKITTI